MHAYSLLFLTRQSSAGWGLAQLGHQQVISEQLAAACLVLNFWHLKHLLGSSSSFVAWNRLPSTTSPFFRMLFAVERSLVVKIAWADLWFSLQLLGARIHLADVSELL